jgi:hypothetical protein
VHFESNVAPKIEKEKKKKKKKRQEKTGGLQRSQSMLAKS